MNEPLKPHLEGVGDGETRNQEPPCILRQWKPKPNLLIHFETGEKEIWGQTKMMCYCAFYAGEYNGEYMSSSGRTRDAL